MDYNHNERYPSNCVKVESVYPDTKGIIPSVVTSDDEDMDDLNVDSGTESCDSKDSINNRKGERKRPGRKKGQGNYFFFTVWFYRIITQYHFIINPAGLGGSVGCAVRLETRRSRVQPPPRSATFFRGDWSWNIFYGHSLPSADSRRAVVSFWRKNVHNTG